MAVIASLLTRLGIESSSFMSGLADARKELKKTQREFEKIGSKLQDVGAGFSKYLTVPVLGVGAAALKLGGDFESAMNRVAISTQGSAAEMKAMSALALDLGKSTVFGASDAAGAMDELAKTGLSAKQILDGAARAAVDLASAAGTELAPAATAIADVMTQFRITGAQLPETVNQITGAVNQSKLGFEDYQQAIAAAGGVAGSLGVGFADFNAALAGTSALFSSGSDAGTSFKTFLTTLVPQSKEAAAVMEKYGLSFFDAAGKMKPLAAIAEELKSKLGDLSNKEMTEALKTAFGQDAMKIAIGLMAQGSAGIETIKAKIAETDAAAQSAQRLKGFNGQLEQMKGAFETLAIALANSGLLAAATSLTVAFAGFLEKLAGLNPEVLKIGLAIGAALAVIGPIVGVVGSLVTGFAALLPVIKMLGVVLGPLNAIIMLVARSLFALALNPVGATIMAIAAAVGVAYLAWKNWDKIEPILRKMFAAVKTWLVDKLNQVWTWLKGRIDAVKDWFFGLYDAVVGNSYVPDMVDEIGDHMRRLDEEMVRPAQGATAKVKAQFEKLRDDLRPILDRLFPEMAEAREVERAVATINRGFKAGLLDATSAAEARRRAIGGVPDAPVAASGSALEPIIDPDAPRRFVEALEPVREKLSDLQQIGRAFTGDLARGLADTVVYGRSLGDTLVNTFKRAAASLLESGILNILSGGNEGTSFGASFAGLGKLFGGFRAAGGPVSAGKAYVVGERRPELFVPRVPGTILPSVGGGGGGTRVFDLRGAMVTSELIDALSTMTDAKIIGAAPIIQRNAARATINHLRRQQIP